MLKNMTTVVFCVLLAACTGPTNNSSNAPIKAQQIQQKNIEKAQPLVISKVENSEIVKAPQAKVHGQANVRRLLLNGKKFQLLSKSVSQGAKVFDESLREYARIKDDIVVVLDKKLAELPKGLNVSHSEKIADRTYRLTPTKNNQLLTLYKKCLADPAFNVVELSLDYSPMPSKTLR